MRGRMKLSAMGVTVRVIVTGWGMRVRSQRSNFRCDMLTGENTSGVSVGDGLVAKSQEHRRKEDHKGQQEISGENVQTQKHRRRKRTPTAGREPVGRRLHTLAG